MEQPESSEESAARKTFFRIRSLAGGREKIAPWE